MKSGLYARAGRSATARAAACAKRFEEPMMKRSKVYFGLTPVGEVQTSLRSTSSRTGSGAVDSVTSASRGSATESRTPHSCPTRSFTVARRRSRKCPSIHSRVNSLGTDTTKKSSFSSLPPAAPNQVWKVASLRASRSRSATAAQRLSALSRSECSTCLTVHPPSRAEVRAYQRRGGLTTGIYPQPEIRRRRPCAGLLVRPHCNPQVWRTASSAARDRPRCGHKADCGVDGETVDNFYLAGLVYTGARPENGHRPLGPATP